MNSCWKYVQCVKPIFKNKDGRFDNSRQNNVGIFGNTNSTDIYETEFKLLKKDCCYCIDCIKSTFPFSLKISFEISNLEITNNSISNLICTKLLSGVYVRVLLIVLYYIFIYILHDHILGSSS